MTISAVGLNIAAGGLTVAGDVGIGGAITSATAITTSNALTAGSLTDGTMSIASGSLTGVVGITASGTITDGTMSVASGAFTAVASIVTTGDVTVGGALSKASGTFDIQHPLSDDPRRRLRHSFVESPLVDNLYIGEATLNATGFASVDLDAYFALTPGTFAALNGKPRVGVMANDCLAGWAMVGAELSVWSRPALQPLGLYCGAGAVVTFHVTAERRDAHILESGMTDARGRLVPEYRRA